MATLDRISRSDFSTPDEILIEIVDSPDKFGRSRFFARWLDDNEWRGGGGISGQVFVTNLEEWIEAQERPVRVLEEEAS